MKALRTDLQIFNEHQDNIRFFIDGDRFSKVFWLHNKENFVYERDRYEILSEYGFVPYRGHVCLGDCYSIELEYVPSPPLAGLGKTNTSWERLVYTPCQKKSILKQYNYIFSVLEKLDMVNRIDLGLSNLIYDCSVDRLYLIDLAQFNLGNFKEFYNNIVEVIKNLPEAKESNYIEMLSYFNRRQLVFAEKHDKNLFQLGEDLINDYEGLSWNYQTIRINGELVRGCRHPDYRWNLLKLGSLRGKSILDLGCAAGGSVLYFAFHNASKILGIESDAKRVKYARRLLSYYDKINPSWKLLERCQVVQDDVTKFDYPKADIAFVLSVLVEDSYSILSKLKNRVTEIYYEGHASLMQEYDNFESFIRPIFGDSWEWQFLGVCDSDFEGDILARPLWRGTKR